MKSLMKFMKRIFAETRNLIPHHQQNIEQISSSKNTFTKALFKRRSVLSKKVLRRLNLRYKNLTSTRFSKLMQKGLNRKLEEIKLAWAAYILQLNMASCILSSSSYKMQMTLMMGPLILEAIHFSIMHWNTTAEKIFVNLFYGNIRMTLRGPTISEDCRQSVRAATR